MLWLRFAVSLYGVGLLYALLVPSRRSEWLDRLVLPAVYAGMILHFVSLTEATLQAGHLLNASVHNSLSLLAFVMMLGFMGAWFVYRTMTLGIVAFPLVFLLTFFAALGQQPILFASEGMRTGWLIGHIGLIFMGYAALVVSFGASVLYLIQASNLKSKRPSEFLGKLPALEVIDELSYKALLIGFPFMTAGLVAGSVVAAARFGPTFFLDSKVLLSLVMWCVYLIMLFARWNNGWRGRRAAYMAAFAFSAAVVAWAANFFSNVHRYVQP